jgi:hypothetical protein
MPQHKANKLKLIFNSAFLLAFLYAGSLVFMPAPSRAANSCVLDVYLEHMVGNGKLDTSKIHIGDEAYPEVHYTNCSGFTASMEIYKPDGTSQTAQFGKVGSNDEVHYDNIFKFTGTGEYQFKGIANGAQYLSSTLKVTPTAASQACAVTVNFDVNPKQVSLQENIQLTVIATETDNSCDLNVVSIVAHLRKNGTEFTQVNVPDLIQDTAPKISSQTVTANTTAEQLGFKNGDTINFSVRLNYRAHDYSTGYNKDQYQESSPVAVTVGGGGKKYSCNTETAKCVEDPNGLEDLAYCKSVCENGGDKYDWDDTLKKCVVSTAASATDLATCQNAHSGGGGGGGTTASDKLYNPLPTDNLTDTFLSIVRGFILIIAAWAVMFIIVGGFQMVMASGNEEMYLKAKKTITWAVLGLVVALLSFSVIAIVQNLLGANITYLPK